MPKFIFGTFLVLGLAFYLLSGGPDFVPEERMIAEAPPAISEEIVEAEADIEEAVEDAIEVATVEAEPVIDVQTTRADTSCPFEPGNSSADANLDRTDLHVFGDTVDDG